MKTFDKFAGTVSRALAVLSTACVLAIVIGTVADVAVRSFTSQPIPGTLEYTEVLVVAMIYLGMAQAQRQGIHVKVTALVNYLPATWRRYFRLVALLAMAVVVGWLGWMAAIAADTSIAAGEYRWGLLKVPMWPARIALFVGLVALWLETILSAIKAWYGEDSALQPDSDEAATGMM